MKNKIGYLNEGFFGTFDEDEYKDSLADEVTLEVIGEKVPLKLSDIDNYKYKFDFYFSGMKYSKKPALNIKRFAAFKNWFMYAVDNCYIFDDYEEPIFCAYQFGNSWRKGNTPTDEIMRFGNVLFNNTEYDINHRIFWDDTDIDPKKHKYGAGYLKFTFAFNATCKNYGQVMRLLTTLCIIFEKGAHKAFDGTKKDGTRVVHCNPDNIRDRESGAQISLLDIHQIAKRTKKSYNLFAKWCDTLAGLKKSKEMLNYYNKTNVDDNTYTLYRYLEAQFDEIHKVYSDDNKKLILELHTSYSPKKGAKKLVDKAKKFGYDLKLDTYTGDNDNTHKNLYSFDTYIENVDDIKAIESMLSDYIDDNRNLIVNITVRPNDKTKFTTSTNLDFTGIQDLCGSMSVSCACKNGYQWVNGHYIELDTSKDYPMILVRDKKTNQVKQICAKDNYSRNWKSTSTYDEGSTNRWTHAKNYMYV